MLNNIRILFMLFYLQNYQYVQAKFRNPIDDVRKKPYKLNIINILLRFCFKSTTCINFFKYLHIV